MMKPLGTMLRSCFGVRIPLVLFFGLSFAQVLATDDGYEFYGRHLIAQYFDCDHDALCDRERLAEVMQEAAEASGARILSCDDHYFDENGYTMVILLSESHASIHTYPEYNACFVDLFTCGKSCSAEDFETVLREYLKPEQVDSQIHIRK